MFALDRYRISFSNFEEKSFQKICDIDLDLAVRSGLAFSRGPLTCLLELCETHPTQYGALSNAMQHQVLVRINVSAVGTDF